MRCRNLLWAVGLACSLSACAAKQAVPCAPGSAQATGGDDLPKLSNEQLARKMLEVTGAAGLGKQVIDGMSDILKKSPGLPAGFMERFKQNAIKEDLTELIVPIYMKHYDRETMIAAVRFYQSEPGRALVLKLPQVTDECMKAGQAWGTRLAEKTLRDLGVSVPNHE